MENKKYFSEIESMLFTWGEPLSIKKMADVLDIPYVEVKQNILEMQEAYKANDRGLQLVEINSSFQLSTKRENHAYIEKLCKRSKSKGLSQATVEVMAIVAYQQPITRTQIEQIRGVSCDRAIKVLVDRELIEVKGRLEQIGKPVIYGTTDVFLKCFGFKSIKELPIIAEFQQLNMFDIEEE